MKRRMGRLTSEKIASIRKSFMADPSYKRVAEKENVDWKTVQKYTSEPGLLEQTIQSGRERGARSTLHYKPRESESSQAFRLMKKQTDLIEIAIDLGLEESKVIDYHRQYVRLKQHNDLDRLYEKLGGDQPLAAFAQLFERLDDAGMLDQVPDFVELLKKEKELTTVTPRLEEERKALADLESRLGNANSELTKATAKLKETEARIEERRRNLSSSDDAIARYESNERHLLGRISHIEEAIFALRKKRHYKKLRYAIVAKIINTLEKKDSLISPIARATVLALRSFQQDNRNVLVQYIGRDEFLNHKGQNELAELREKLYGNVKEELAHVLIHDGVYDFHAKFDDVISDLERMLRKAEQA